MTTKRTHLLNFYALAGAADEPTVFSVPMERHVQEELSVEFTRQLDAFGLESADHIRYAPQYNPSDDELFAISTFSLPAALTALPHSPDVPSLTDKQIEEGFVRGLVGVQQGPRTHALLCFQAMDSRSILTRKRFRLVFDRQVFARNSNSGLVVKESLSCVFRNGTLFFRSEAATKRLLDISLLFREATDPELTAFFSHESFDAREVAALLSDADTWTRRKVTSISASKVLERVDIKHIVSEAHAFARLDLTTRRRDGKLVIVLPPAKKELKTLLKLLDQDFLSSTITPDRFLANSKRPV